MTLGNFTYKAIKNCLNMSFNEICDNLVSFSENKTLYNDKEYLNADNHKIFYKKMQKIYFCIDIILLELLLKENSEFFKNFFKINDFIENMLSNILKQEKKSDKNLNTRKNALSTLSSDSCEQMFVFVKIYHHFKEIFCILHNSEYKELLTTKNLKKQKKNLIK